MLKKENKIMVIVSTDPREREAILRRLIVELGFALTPGDASKIIRPEVYSVDLSRAYFIFCSNYNFRDSTITNHRLYEMAARGIAVVVGVRNIPRELEFICQPFYASDFDRL